MALRILAYLKPIIDVIIFSNIWIALAALSLFSSILKVSGNTEEFYAALTVFTGTFISYNFLKLKGINFESNNSVFFTWLRRYKYVVYSLLILALLSLLYAIYHLSILQISTCIVSALISLIYIGVEKFNLRHFWFLKTPVVAFVWAFFIVSLAFVDQYFLLNYVYVAYLFLACFLFIQGLTIAFEIRDLKTDSTTVGLKTIPMIIGLNGTKYLAILHLVLALLFYILYSIKLLILTPIILLAIFTIYQLNEESSEYSYTFILDGLIVLSFPLVCLVY